MRTWAMGLLVLALGGCAALPAPPLHSAWYLQYNDQLYVALLNRSEREIKVEDVIVNRSDNAGAIGWQWCPEEATTKEKSLSCPTPQKTSKSDSARAGANSPSSTPESKDKPKAPVKLVLQPGRLVTLPAREFKRSTESFDQECLLPVDIVVVLAEESRPWFERWFSRAQGDPEGMIRAELVGRMPSSLPEGWDKNCGALGAAAKKPG